MAICQFCNKQFSTITNTHLFSCHNISLKEYITKFGNEGIGFKVRVAELPKDDPRHISWRKSLLNRPPTWCKGQTKYTNPSLAKMVRTFKEKGIDNFKKWREQARKMGRYPYINHPPIEHSKDLAYLVGMALGDGHIQKLERVETLRICLGTDKPLLWKYTARVLENIFGKKPHIYKPKTNCLVLGIHRKELSVALQVPTGARKSLEIRLPDWIWKEEGYLISCLKGLFEAEGSFSIHIPTCTYNMQFSNLNFSLLNEVESALVKLGYHPERRNNSVRLRKRHEALSFESLINFRKFDKII